MNSTVSALRFFFTGTLNRPDLARTLVRVAHPRRLSEVLSREEVVRLLAATTCRKHQAALSVACAVVCVYFKWPGSTLLISTASAC